MADSLTSNWHAVRLSRSLDRWNNREYQEQLQLTSLFNCVCRRKHGRFVLNRFECSECELLPCTTALANSYRSHDLAKVLFLPVNSVQVRPVYWVFYRHFIVCFIQICWIGGKCELVLRSEPPTCYPARPSCCTRWCSYIYLKKKHTIYFSRSDLPQTVDKNHKSWKGSYNFQPHHSVPFTWLGFKCGDSMSWIHKVCVCLMDCVRFLSPGGDCYSAIKRCFSARGISRWMCSSWLLMGPLVWAATAALRTSRRSVGLCLTAITL